uniref:Ubiquitin-like-conjugating enzyme ATG10 n=1 Tax=Callithrix jacchus TaxID=9483 RepID=A0A8I3XAZ6_CALJA
MEEDEFIGEKTFQRCCAEFIKHSQQIGDSWEWRPSKDCSDGYMCKIHFQIKNEPVMSHPGTSAYGQTCLPMEEAFELPSDDCEVTEAPAASQVIKYEYHVLYSCSYQVPVLYFRASFLDGRPLTLKDIWEGVHECYKTRLLQGPWETITQQALNYNLSKEGHLEKEPWNAFSHHGPVNVSIDGMPCILFWAKRITIKFKNQTWLDLTGEAFGQKATVDPDNSNCSEESARLSLKLGDAENPRSLAIRFKVLPLRGDDLPRPETAPPPPHPLF